MFRSMRRFKQLIKGEDAIEILRLGKTGALSVIGDGGYPYVFPMNYVYYNQKLYFHSAVNGHKIDAILQNNKVSFCVVERDIPVPERFTTSYRSVIAFGKAQLLEDEAAKTQVMQALNSKYSSGYEKEGDTAIEKAMNRMAVIELNIEQLTGKASMELINP